MNCQKCAELERENERIKIAAAEATGWRWQDSRMGGAYHKGDTVALRWQQLPEPIESIDSLRAQVATLTDALRDRQKVSDTFEAEVARLAVRLEEAERTICKLGGLGDM